MPTIKVIQSVVHGRHNLDAGDIRTDLPQADINTLKELGFVEDHPDAEAPDDDLIGGKVDTPVANKMEPDPKNKAAAPKPKK